MTTPPGTEKPRRYLPRLRYELIGCALNGHELVGADARAVRPSDQLVVRDYDGLRWCRCLRCDSWIPLPPPEQPTRPFPPERDEIDLPLRGRQLRDRYVLRLIAIDRVLHALVLGTLAALIFVFAHDRQRLHNAYLRILADFQGGLGGPVNNTDRGIFSELNRLFALSTSKLYLYGAIAAAFAAILALEAVGLWLGRRWAEYLTFVETSVLIPFEIYELVNRASALKILTLVLNVAVVAYLLVSKRLFGLRGGAAADRRERLRDSGWEGLEASYPYLAATAGSEAGPGGARPHCSG